MPQVCVLEFDKKDRLFKVLSSRVHLSSVPTAGDKFTMKIKDVGYIFDVYDVHYAHNKQIDVNVVRISNIESYHSCGFHDIR
ncbi:MAG: hypothetical protein JWR72_2393 [Flavisolibacter sp.]|jgi:hypothetical protein|nr:hypothetical protein [Flavisolibacter sp.]